jgi:two-component system sensor histidine kinase RegB
MGLGFFIAKTLLERTGAEVKFRNGRRGGAVVCVIWPRYALAPPVTPMGTGVEPQA